MKSKDFREQVKIDRTTLSELYKLDNLNKRKYEKFGKINLLSLTFVQLQQYLSSSIINKNVKPYSKFSYFPCVNSSYLNTNTNFKNKIDKKLFTLNADKIKKKIYSSLPFTNISTCNVFSDIYKELGIELNKKFILRKTVSLKPIYLNFLDEQFELLERYLDKFAKRYKIKNTGYSRNFINYIKNYFSYDKINIDNSKILFVGSNGLLENRITSANYLLNNRKVISFNHTNYNTLIIDEPHQEYSEHVFCNYYVDYGSLNKNKKKLKSDFLAPKHFIHLNNPKIYKLSSNDNISKKIVYVPDSFNGDHRHGPYREMDDRKYYKFQKIVLKSDKNILIKKHPKETKIYNSDSYAFKYFKINKDRILRDQLLKIVSKYRLFIVDRISQAFFDLARSETKILYFNIGRRKIKKNILKEIKKRACVINIDPYSVNKNKIKKCLKRAIRFKIKKSKILNLTSNSNNKNFNKILKLL